MRAKPVSITRNFAFLLVLESCWAIGVWLANPMTVVPNFLIRLGASTTVIGLLPALWALGQGLGALGIGAFVVHRRRLGGFMGLWHYIAILPYVGLAMLGLFADSLKLEGWIGQSFALAMLMAYNLIIGAMIQLYLVLLSRLIPAPRRGRLFGILFSVTPMIGLLGPLLASRYFITDNSTLADYGRLFLTAWLLFALGSAPFFLIRERPADPLPRRDLKDNLASLYRTWRGSAQLRDYLTARMWLGGGVLAGTFLATYSRAEAALGEHRITVLGTLLVAGEAASSLVLGWLSSSSGSGKRAALSVFIRLQWIVQATLLAVLVFAALRPGPCAAVALAFAAGMSIAGDFVVHPNVLFGMGPSRLHTDMVSLSSIVLTPVILTAPPLCGAAIGALGHRPVFLVAALLGVPGLVKLWFLANRLTEKPAAHPQSGSAG